VLQNYRKSKKPTNGPDWPAIPCERRPASNVQCSTGGCRRWCALAWSRPRVKLRGQGLPTRHFRRAALQFLPCPDGDPAVTIEFELPGW